MDCLERVGRTGFVPREVELPPVPTIEVPTADDVYLIPARVFAGLGWARLRIELARAARLFVVEVSGNSTAEVVQAMRDGAFDVVGAGESGVRWKEAFEGAARSQRLWLDLYAGKLDVEGERLVGRSTRLTELRRELERLGPTDVTVLLLGESGVGKERVAAALHEAGRGGPLVTLNCAAMPRELMEAELFGAERGAFTGAIRSRPGLVEQANGGTLFLDEIGELDLLLQPKLLRFLETRRARRVGGEAEYAVRVRIVSATNRDLEREVREGRFRADLFYRLAEVILQIPPLRERREDIPDLARTFLQMANERFGKAVDGLEPELVARLQQYSWPGNVRELKGAIDRLVLFHDGPMLRVGWWEPPTASTVPLPAPVDLPVVVVPPVGLAPPPPAPAAFPGYGEAGGATGFPGRAARVELARRMLEEGRVSLSEIAARVGIHPTTLFRWRKLGKTGGQRAGEETENG